MPSLGKRSGPISCVIEKAEYDFGDHAVRSRLIACCYWQPSQAEQDAAKEMPAFLKFATVSAVFRPRFTPFLRASSRSCSRVMA
jgi:hypothetical protein